MKRINVSFYNETYEKLERRMQEKGGKSVANGIRELVDLGFKVEEAAKRNEGGNPETDNLVMLLKFAKNNLLWSLEILFLVRHFIQAMPDQQGGKALEKYKESAASYIQGMCHESIK